jgi:glycosyltransferase involved in cell wall biosynthesis
VGAGVLTRRERYGRGAKERAVSFTESGTVLHVITDLDRGGAEAMLVRLVVAAQLRGSVKNIVVSLLDGGVHANKLREAGIEVHSLQLSRFANLPGAFIKLVRLMRHVRPSLIMTWLYHADLIGTLAAIVSGVGTKRLIWNLRCSNIDFDRYAWTTRWTVKLLTLLSPLPRLVSVNSRAGQGAHEALGYRPRDWMLLPNGIDLDEYRPDGRDRIHVRNELGLDATTFAVGVIARVDPQKDHATLLDAAERVVAEYPHVRFVLVGRHTDKLPRLDRVTVLGERHDIARLLRGLDVVVLSSAYGEGTPNVLAEAMATGIPCVATDVGDAAALVEQSGIVISPQNPSELAAAIQSLLYEAAQARALRGQRARETIRRWYNIEGAADRYYELCNVVLNKVSVVSRVEQGVAA